MADPIAPYLVKVPGTPYTFRADAAASYLRMLPAGMPAGGIDVSSRTLAQQRAVLRGPNLAAPATLNAPHVRGCAADFHTTNASTGKYDPSASFRWITAGISDPSKAPGANLGKEKNRGRAYGWTRTVRSERWHLGYNPSLDTKAAADLDARLKALGYTGLTQTARVKAFQRAHGLTVDGKAGPQTWHALLVNPRPAKPATPPAPKPPTPKPPTPQPPKPLPVPTLARVGTFNCGGWGKKSMTAKQIDALVKAIKRVNASIVALTECPSWLRDHLRGTCKCRPGSHKTVGNPKYWRVAIRGVGFSQAILFDNRKWAYQGATGIEFGPTSYHGGLIARFVQITTKARLTFAAYHLPPNSVSSDNYQKRAMAKLLDKVNAIGGARIVAGDGADDSAWIAGYDDARVKAKTSSTRENPTYGKAIRDRIHSKGVTHRVYTVIGSGGASDHSAVLDQITIPA